MIAFVPRRSPRLKKRKSPFWNISNFMIWKTLKRGSGGQAPWVSLEVGTEISVRWKPKTKYSLAFGWGCTSRRKKKREDWWAPLILFQSSKLCYTGTEGLNPHAIFPAALEAVRFSSLQAVILLQPKRWLVILNKSYRRVLLFRKG